MVCLYCGHKTSVVNSRSQKKTNQTWRRRKCLSCGAIFTSVELADLRSSILYLDKSGHSKPFERDKLLISIYESLKHRNDAQAAATALTSTILSKAMPGITNASITREQIIGTSLKVLNHFDKAAAVQFAAYHHI